MYRYTRHVHDVQDTFSCATVRRAPVYTCISTREKHISHYHGGRMDNSLESVCAFTTKFYKQFATCIYVCKRVLGGMFMRMGFMKRVYTHTKTGMCEYAHARTHSRSRTHNYMRSLFVYIYTSTHIYTCSHPYIHLQIDTHIHTLTHTCIGEFSRKSQT
jgi:hypothetical protein